MIRFFNFFLDHMVQKYQNEIPPIFYYRISTKSSEKVLKIPNLQALTLGRIIKITLYNNIYSLQVAPLHPAIRLQPVRSVHLQGECEHCSLNVRVIASTPNNPALLAG